MANVKGNIESIYKYEWLLNFNDFIILTNDILKLFGLVDDEISYITKINRLKIPYEEIGKFDKRIYIFNDITHEMKLKPNKKTWYIMKTSNFKKSLFLVGNTRVINDLKKHYIDMEECIKKIYQNNLKNVKDFELVQAAIDKALQKYTVIIEEKILEKLATN